MLDGPPLLNARGGDRTKGTLSGEEDPREETLGSSTGGQTLHLKEKVWKRPERKS